VRLSSTKEPPGIKPGEYKVIFAVGPISIIRDVVAADVVPHKGIQSGNIWTKERVGGEWVKGNWKWDSRWK
jgi:hypothetical protein